VGRSLLRNKKGKETSEKERDKKDPNKNDAANVSNFLVKSLEDNISMLSGFFKDDDTLIVRRFENQQNNNIKCCILFIEGMTNDKEINENIIEPVVTSCDINNNNIIEQLMYHVIASNNVEKTADVNKMLEAIVSGDTVLLAEGTQEALTISTKGWSTRAIEEPQAEKNVRGPREGFTESIMVNLSMIRRKLRTHNLKFKFRVLGKKTNTRICICYIDDIANKQILHEVQKRLDQINIDGILSSQYITEMIRDSPWSPFKTIGNTERPEVVASKLLEGRIAIVVDGTPVTLTMPHVFVEYFQASEDYSINFYFSSISRVLRILCFIITISVPAVFIALITYDQEMVPTPLLISIAASRQNVPFPSAIELILLLLVFDILRETGIRMPSFIGEALSVVGALVVGTAAVDARFVSAPMVIIAALAGITELGTTRLQGASILLRLVFIFLASILGLYGFIFGVIGLLIHLYSMRSFGVPYMQNLMNLNPEDIIDTAIRAPWPYMKFRQNFIASKNRIRNKSGGRNK